MHLSVALGYDRIERRRTTIGRLLLILIIFITVITGLSLWAVTYPGAVSGATTGVVFVAGLAVIIASVFHLLWRPMLAKFPPRTPAPDAVRRRFQSFGLGIVNMGLSVHVAVDDEYLHLVPLSIWQTLGARPASIPWSEMEPVGTSRRAVRVDGHRLDGPRWCMQLAFPGDEVEGD